MRSVCLLFFIEYLTSDVGVTKSRDARTDMTAHPPAQMPDP